MNVALRKPYKMYEGKTNDVSIAFIDYVNDLNKLQQFKVKREERKPTRCNNIDGLLSIMDVGY